MAAAFAAIPAGLTPVFLASGLDPLAAALAGVGLAVLGVVGGGYAMTKSIQRSDDRKAAAPAA